MKTGTRICHALYPKKHGVVVAHSADGFVILWDGEGIPRRHPRDYVVPIEAAAAIPDAVESEHDEPEGVEDIGVSELSLEIITEIEDDVLEPEETDADTEDVIESEVIG
jgi:hypothetical protein